MIVRISCRGRQALEKATQIGRYLFIYRTTRCGPGRYLEGTCRLFPRVSSAIAQECFVHRYSRFVVGAIGDDLGNHSRDYCENHAAGDPGGETLRCLIVVKLATLVHWGRGELAQCFEHVILNWLRVVPRPRWCEPRS